MANTATLTASVSRGCHQARVVSHQLININEITEDANTARGACRCAICVVYGRVVPHLPAVAVVALAGDAGGALDELAGSDVKEVARRDTCSIQFAAAAAAAEEEVYQRFGR
jgi:hypothetical protein